MNPALLLIIAALAYLGYDRIQKNENTISDLDAKLKAQSAANTTTPPVTTPPTTPTT